MSAPELNVGDVVAITVRARYSNGISFYYGVVSAIEDGIVSVEEPGAGSGWDLSQVDGHYLDIRVIAPEEIAKNKTLRDHLGPVYRSEGSDA